MSTETPGETGASLGGSLRVARNLARHLGLLVLSLLGLTLPPGSVGQDPKLAALSARVEALESNAVKVGPESRCA